MTSMQIINSKPFMSNPEISSIYPLSEGQKGLWTIYKISPDNTAYNQYNTVKINSSLDLKRWKATWQQIIKRHPHFTHYLWDG